MAPYRGADIIECVAVWCPVDPHTSQPSQAANRNSSANQRILLIGSTVYEWSDSATVAERTEFSSAAGLRATDTPAICVGREGIVMTITEHIEGYAAAAIEHGDATEASNSDRANEAYGRLQRHWDGLRVCAGDWPASFLELLRHENKWVRLWAASHALAIEPKAAVPILEVLSQETGLHAFDAQMTLKTWSEGNLNPPA